MATLFIASGEHDGRFFPIRKKTLVVGRDEGVLAQVVDPMISRKHLMIRYDDEIDAYFASDMGSKNGVFVNNEQIVKEVHLQNDDLVRIGDTLLLFVEQDFDGENNALAFYRERGQRDAQTLDMNINDLPKPKPF